MILTGVHRALTFQHLKMNSLAKYQMGACSNQSGPVRGGAHEREGN